MAACTASGRTEPEAAPPGARLEKCGVILGRGAPDAWDGTNAQDGLAMTSAEAFPLGWEPYAGNPVLRIGPADAYDAVHAAKPFIFRTPDRHYHFYTAVDTAETREIALAVEPGPCR